MNPAPREGLIAHSGLTSAMRRLPPLRCDSCRTLRGQKKYSGSACCQPQASTMSTASTYLFWSGATEMPRSTRGALYHQRDPRMREADQLSARHQPA